MIIGNNLDSKDGSGKIEEVYFNGVDCNSYKVENPFEELIFIYLKILNIK